MKSIKKMLLKHKTMKVCRKRTITELYNIFSDMQWHNSEELYNKLLKIFNPMGCSIYYNTISEDLHTSLSWYKFNDLLEIRHVCVLDAKTTYPIYKLKTGVTQ